MATRKKSTTEYLDNAEVVVETDAKVADDTAATSASEEKSADKAAETGKSRKSGKTRKTRKTKDTEKAEDAKEAPKKRRTRKSTSSKKADGSSDEKSTGSSTKSRSSRGKSSGTRKKSTGTRRKKKTEEATEQDQQQELLFDDEGKVKEETPKASESKEIKDETATAEAESAKLEAEAKEPETESAEPVETVEKKQVAETAEPEEPETESPQQEAEPETESHQQEAEPEHEPEADNTVEIIVPFEIIGGADDESEPEAEPEPEQYDQASEETADTFSEPDQIDETASTAELTENDTEEIEPDDNEEEPDEAPEEKPHHLSPVASRLCGLIFAAILILTFALNIIIRDKQYSDQENRVFQQMPEFSAGNYLSGRFESQLDNYANDQFMFRNAFIKIKSAADLTIGQLKANGVFKCRDNYLMEDITYPDKEDEAADINALKTFKKKYSAKKMYFMLVPNAANILSSKLPGAVVTRDQNADMDRLFDAVEDLGYKTIDVRDELAKASKEKQVYYRTDHHWTTDGAYVAYQKAHDVMKLKSNINYKPYVVKKNFVGTLYSKSGFTNGKNDPITIYLPDDKKALNSVIRYADTKEKTTNYYDMENLNKKDAYTVFGGTNHSLFSISTPVRKNRNLLVIKDSYANCFIPFLTQDYRTITVVDPRYYYENIATVIKANDIDEVLFLYNANTFFADNYMRMMLTNK